MQRPRIGIGSLVIGALATIALPLVASAQMYGGHVFAPYTYINTSPYVQVTPSYSYSYPSYSNSYSYPYSNYSYPSYSSPSYSYSYPTYYDEYWYSQYPSYSYSSYGYDSYGSYNDYGWGNSDDYCYSGYGCYPMYVEDPHQWIYDSWGGYWY